MTKLFKIRLARKDEVRGNYILMTSGTVMHVGPGHLYIVSEEQTKLLDKEGIRYSIILEDGEPTAISLEFAEAIIKPPKCPECGGNARHSLTYNWCPECGWRSDLHDGE